MRLTFLFPFHGMEFLATAAISGEPLGRPGAVDAVSGRAMALAAITNLSKIINSQFGP